MRETEIYGLVLIGGESTRMGTDKSLIQYHGKPQVDHTMDILESLLLHAFISARSNPRNDPKIIVDKYKDAGPINGILTAMESNDQVAWLVLAVDLPFLTTISVERLISARDSSKIATVYATEPNNFPEPLVGIWEPQALPLLKNFHSHNPRKGPNSFLKENDVKLLYPKNGLELFNANSLGDANRAKKAIGVGSG